MSKVMYATDYSTSSRNILAYAAALARDRQATLLVVHVLEMDDYPVGELFDEEPHPPSSEVERLEAMKPVGFDVRVEHRLVFGRHGAPQEALCQLARKEQVDVLVIGTHGQTADGNVPAGTVAAAILKLAPCPVVAIKHPSERVY